MKMVSLASKYLDLFHDCIITKLFTQPDFWKENLFMVGTSLSILTNLRAHYDYLINLLTDWPLPYLFTNSNSNRNCLQQNPFLYEAVYFQQTNNSSPLVVTPFVTSSRYGGVETKEVQPKIINVQFGLVMNRTFTSQVCPF